jgi:hypothetical protein
LIGKGTADRFREIARNTAFTSPLALRLPTFPVSFTASSTAADAGTRERCNSW